jgi:two-component system OmpR family sensor kinase
VSLRARLLLVAVSLVAVGLVVSGVATHRLLSRFLVQRVDQQLIAAQPLVLGALDAPFGGRVPAGLTLPPGTYAEIRDASGETVRSTFFGYGASSAASPPDLPADLPGSEGGAGGHSVFTATSRDRALNYRVLATGPRIGSGTLIVAIPMTDVSATLRRLLAVEVVVGGIVLGAVAALALWLVRLGLRPLGGIGETAGAIAAGDLSRRVEPDDERTEVGRLGRALNAMLAQIEEAFEERRASEARLRRFVADASHELRTPLTSIRGYAELFRRGADARPTDLAKSMARIEEEASRMGVLVDDLLLLARLDQGRPLERRPVDLAAVVADAVEGARAVEPDRPIELASDGPVELAGDEHRLRQVADNLLDNVRVHTPAGTPVRVRVASEGEEAVLEVADEGPGLAPEVAGRAFERFVRGDPSRSRGTGGAGLGLSIVAAIVEAHGGRVTATERDGGGAAFEVRLPLGGPRRGVST